MARRTNRRTSYDGGHEPPLTDFTKIQFGYRSAEREGADAPELLLRGFIDHGDLTNEALNESRWLFLGYKGSGKSAIGERARLLSRGDPLLFVTTATLSEFPHDALEQMAVPYQSAWSFFLLVELLGSLRTDAGAEAEDRDFQSALSGLQRLGLVPAPDLRTLVLTSASRGFRLELPKIAKAVVDKTFEEADVALTHVVTYMQKMVSHFVSTARHVLIVDGLDEPLARHDESVAALILAASRLNADFVRWGSAAKIVVLCRTDIFDHLPGANKNKIRGDWGVALDWYHDPREPDSSALIELANVRAELSLERPCEVLREYFPGEIREGDVRKLLLDHTRHTPRDFVELLRSMQTIVQRAYAAGESELRLAVRRLSREQILSGLRHYSLTYFLPEIRDELDGVFEPSEIEQIVAMLSAARKREVSFGDLQASAAELGLKELDVEHVVRALFECSALGTVLSNKTTTRFTFKYRNRHAAVSMKDRFNLHRGVWKALDLV